jgi:hypothetical protein
MYNLTESIVLPPLEMIIYFDIEYNPEENLIWSIAVKLGEFERVFFSENKLDEDLVLNQFTLFLTRHPFFPLLCYSVNNYDFRIIESKFEKYPELATAMKDRAWLDLGYLLKKKSEGRIFHKLGSLALQYGYPMREFMNSEVKNKLYSRSLSSFGYIPSELKKQLVSYNFDCVRILPYILDKMDIHIQTQDCYWGEIDFSFFKHNISRIIFDNSRIRVQTTHNPEYVAQEIMKLGMTLPKEIGANEIIWTDNLSLKRWKEIDNKILLNQEIEVLNH